MLALSTCNAEFTLPCAAMNNLSPFNPGLPGGEQVRELSFFMLIKKH